MGKHDYNINKGKEFQIIFGSEILDVKFSKNEKFFVSLIKESTTKYGLTVYSIEDNSEYARIHLDNRPKEYICFDDKGVNYIIASFAGEVNLWNIDSGENCGFLGLNVLNSIVTGIQNFTLSNNGTYVGYTATDKTKTLGNATFCRIFNIKKDIKVYESKHSKTVEAAICISPDNKYIVNILDEGQGLTFNFLMFVGENQLEVHEKFLHLAEPSLTNIKKAIFHPNGQRIFMVRNKKILILDLGSKKIEKCLDFVTTEIDFEFNYNGSLFMSKTNKGFGLFNSETGYVVMDISKEFNNPVDGIKVISASLSPINNHLLLCFNNGVVKSIDVDTYNCDEIFHVDDVNTQVKFRTYTEAKSMTKFRNVLIFVCISFLVYGFFAVYYGW